jgi:glutathione S-transferase
MLALFNIGRLIPSLLPETQVIELYHCADGRSLRCLWLLEELGRPYTLHILPFPPRILAPAYLALNPQGTIPFLVDGTTRMTESAAILEYLTAKAGPTPLRVEPDEPDFGAWLSWLHFGEVGLTAPQTVVLRYGYFETEDKRQPIVQADFIQVFLDKLRVVEAALAGRDYLCADRFTTADISVAYAIKLGFYIGADKLMPRIVLDYWERLQQRPAYQNALAAQAGGPNWQAA